MFRVWGACYTIHMLRKVGIVTAIFFYTVPFFAAGQTAPHDRAALEQQLTEVERQITAYEKTIDNYRAQGKSLKGEIKKFDAEVQKLNLQIKAINLSLTKLDTEIVANKNNINVTNEQLAFNKNALIGALQSLYETDEVTVVEILLMNPLLSDFINTVNGLLMLQDDLRGALTETIETQDKLMDLQEQLALKKTDTAQLKQARDNQKKSLAKKREDKDSLLKETKGQESQYQVLLKESHKTAAQIRSRIFEFLGGGELRFDQAYQLAKSAAGMAGIRPALLLAVLDKESALGKNVGRCKYQTAMHPTRDIPIFLTIAAELGLNPDTLLVSCANRDGAYGGAMGISQFIPSTWHTYRARIETFTANHPPSPWRHIDAFVATALYLKDAGASGERNNEADRKASARYYAGSRWRSYLWTYGERVVVKARQFEEDIAALTGNG